ncbi:MAG: ATP-binding protein [Bacteroidales bacterium]|nr:ATP-binding protein [Bacteroidales bacterium]MBQ2574426.1 ATP-binding protein [Bacteroidales bacterium]
MKRNIYSKLVEWKNKPSGKRKPLILEGARQTGKTWLARELGKNEFESFVEVNFEDSEQLRSIFEMDFDIDRILLAIQSATGTKVEAGKTLLFFDEIQHARRGLLSLKYFHDKAPQYHIIAAGSLLGVIDHKDDSFPVGKVDFINVHPLTFDEFLCALGKDGLADMLRTLDWKAIEPFASNYIEMLRQYYYVGGMPEAVLTFAEEKDYNAVRTVQNNLLKSYERDFSNHPPKEIVQRMIMVWNSVPSQLAKENKKFVYTAVRPSARARDFETSIQWLCNAGVVSKVTRISAGWLPLKGYEDADSFKLYLLDIGLMGAIAGLDAKSLVDGDDFFSQYKGALTEQFVFQQISVNEDMEIHYWTPDVGTAEVDFIIQLGDMIVPLEVKAEKNLKAKSLGLFINQYGASCVVRTSMAPFEQGKTITDLPLFAIMLLPQVIGNIRQQNVRDMPNIRHKNV